MHEGMLTGEPPDPQEGQDVARVRGTAHVDPHPPGLALLRPGQQITARRAGHRRLVSVANGCLDQVTYTDGHAVDRGLRDDQDTVGCWRRTDLGDRFHSPEQPLTDSSLWCIGSTLFRGPLRCRPHMRCTCYVYYEATESR